MRPPEPAPGDKVSGAHNTRRWIGLTMAGAGIVGIGVGATFGVVAISKLAQSNDGPCGSNDHCNQAGLDLRQQSNDAAVASTIAFVTGASLLAVGLTVYLTTPKDRELTVSPTLAAGAMGATVGGRF
jgi:hypothetical protein